MKLKHIIASALTLGLLMFGYGGDSRCQAAETVKIASGGHIVHFAPLDLAVAKGMFTAAGLNVEVVQLQSGTPVALALLSGQVDFSMNGLDHAFKAAAQGKPDMRMIVLLNRVPGMSLVVDSRLRDEIRSIADLKGHPLAVTSRGSATHMVLASLLNRAGVGLNDFTIMEVKPPTFAAALENRQIAGGIALEPMASILASEGKLTILADLNTLADTQKFLGGPYPVAGLMTRIDVLESKPETVRKVAEVLLKSLKWITSHTPEEIADAMPPEVVGTDKGRYITTMAKLREFYSPDGAISVDAARNVLESMRHSGTLPAGAAIRVEDFIVSAAALDAGNFSAAPESSTILGNKWSSWLLAAVLVLVLAMVVFLIRGKKIAV